MVKTRDPCKKIGDTKGTFHAKMETIKGVCGRALRQALESHPTPQKPWR